VIGFFVFVAFASGNGKKEVDIDSTDEIKEFIKGKWHNETVGIGGLTTYYRFEITDTEIKCWEKTLVITGAGIEGNDEWVEQPTVSLSLGSIQTEPESNTSYEKKYRTLGDCDYGIYTFVNNAELGALLYFRENDSNYSDSRCELEKGWEY
jgi:hypothetical protein